MGDLFKNTKQYYQDEYFDNETHERIKRKVKSSIHQHPKKSKRMPYFIAAAGLFLTLVMGSALLSPSVSKVMAEFPLIGYLFDSKDPAPLVSEMENYLKSEGYPIYYIDDNFQKKEYEIAVKGSDPYFLGMKDKIHEKALDFLEDKGLDAYSVKVVQDVKKEGSVPEKKSETLIKEEKAIKEDLEKRGYSIGLAFYIPRSKTFTIGLKEDKQAFSNNHSVVKEEASKLLEKYHRDEYKVEIFRYVEGSFIENVTSSGWARTDPGFRTADVLSSYVEEALSERNLPYQGIQVQFPDHSITGSAWGFQTNAETLKSALPKKFDTVDFGSYHVKVKILSREKMARGEKARQLSRTLAIALAGQKKLHVKTVGSSLAHHTFSIGVSTTLSPNSKDKEQVMEDVKAQIKDFFSSREGKDFLQGNDYEIEFHDKNGDLISN
ncbi:hypothetical protein Q7A53_10720 [Halobacillus rhizosphaerae]|uniref:hypothetical protein n=1 Tax=Halobacillus rhizosphaerae TaxID=3064889 RepID=UPI00398B2E39